MSADKRLESAGVLQAFLLQLHAKVEDGRPVVVALQLDLQQIKGPRSDKGGYYHPYSGL